MIGVSAEPIVVKLGGSNASAPELDIWLAALVDSGCPVVIVPGGGPFADFIRDIQPRLGFSDISAHAMAILAMEQFGHLLVDRQPELQPSRDLADIKTALDASRVALWLPSSLALGADELAMSWAVTSDAIAAWLCSKIGARRLLLIKQSDAVHRGDTIEQLAAIGVVDPMLASMLPAPVELRIAGPTQASGAAAELRRGHMPGISIRRASILKKAG